MTLTTRLVGPADVGLVASLYTSYDALEFGGPVFSASEIEWLLGLPGTCWLTMDDDVPLAFGTCKADGIIDTVSLDPIVRGELLALALADARERGLRRVRHYAGTCGITAAFLQPYGFAHTATTWRLLVDLPFADSPVWPASVEVRPFVRDTDARAVWGTVMEGFRATGFSTDRTFENWLSVVLSESHDVACAWEGEHLLGCSVRGRRLGLGYIAQLAVLPAARGRGIGRALLLESFARDHADGVAASTLTVDGANDRARALYDSVGMRVTQENRQWTLQL